MSGEGIAWGAHPATLSAPHRTAARVMHAQAREHIVARDGAGVVFRRCCGALTGDACAGGREGPGARSRVKREALLRS